MPALEEAKVCDTLERSMPHSGRSSLASDLLRASSSCFTQGSRTWSRQCGVTAQLWRLAEPYEGLSQSNTNSPLSWPQLLLTISAPPPCTERSDCNAGKTTHHKSTEYAISLGIAEGTEHYEPNDGEDRCPHRNRNQRRVAPSLQSCNVGQADDEQQDRRDDQG